MLLGKDQLELVRKQKKLEDAKECLKAFFNFSALSRNFHPLDWSPQSLLKMVIEKHLLAPQRWNSTPSCLKNSYMRTPYVPSAEPSLSPTKRLSPCGMQRSLQPPLTTPSSKILSSQRCPRCCPSSRAGDHKHHPLSRTHPRGKELS